MSLLVVLLTLALVPVQRPSDVVTWSLAGSAASAAPGGVVTVSVIADVQPGWKLYAIEQPEEGPRPLTFELSNSSVFDLAPKKIAAPKGQVQNDENFGVPTRYYEGRTAFSVPVSVRATASPGRHTLPLRVTFQACGQNICLRPATQKLSLELSIAR